MKKLKFSKDEGTQFYKELTERVDDYFSSNNIERTGHHIMYIKIVGYFSLDIVFYYLMITSTSSVQFYRELFQYINEILVAEHNLEYF